MPAAAALPTFAAEAGRQLGVAVVVGPGVGYLLMRLTDAAGVRRLAEEDWFPLAASGLALAVLGLAHMLGGTGVLAAFLAGLVFSEGVPENLREPVHEVHRSISKVGLTVVFLAFGTVLPYDRWWPELGGAGLAFALWVLLLRRLPVAYPALHLTGTGPVSAAFIGWSGPLGVAGVYYLSFAERYRLPEYERLFLAGTLAVTASVIGHALTSVPAVASYRRTTGIEEPEGQKVTVPGPLP